jgi:hypothetical protein
MKKRLSNEEYHALANSLSSSDFKALARSINDWNKERKDSKEMNLGTIFHDFILEDIDRSLVLPKVNRATLKGNRQLYLFLERYFLSYICSHGKLKKLKLPELKKLVEKQETEAKGKLLLIDQAQKDTLEAMKKSFYAHPEASQYIYKKGDSWEVEESLMIEASKIFPDYEGDLLIKIRPDYRMKDENGGYIVDLKSAKSSEPWEFKRDVWKYGYHSSASLYMKVANALGLNVNDFFIVATENCEPFNTEVYRMTEKMLDEGWQVILKGWNRYIDFKNGNDYRGYSRQGEVIEL